jgi:glycosyltransferase involved in cell wall biosynthesis
MIVRDEADNIKRCLNAAKLLISTFTIVDTGSTDGTPELVRQWAEVNDAKGALFESEWQNFKVNRSELMAKAKGSADYLLLLDADMVVHADQPLPDLSEFDSWLGRIGESGSLDYKLPLLVRGDKDWRYEGVAHSYLACDPPHYTESVCPGLWVEDHSRVTETKIQRDIEALSAEHARNPLDARTVFYLAQSYYDLGRYPEAIHYYRMRASMGGWGEEAYYARYRLGCLLSEHVSGLEGMRELLDAWEQRPTRVEALRALSAVSENVANKVPYPDDLLFVHPGAYRDQPNPVGITPDKVSAVVVTRGNVDLEPVLGPIRNAGITDIVVWDNSKLADRKIYGRYLAARKAKNDVIFSVDDDVIFTAFPELLAAYEPGRIVANMDASWAAVYGRETALIGAGALWDKNLPLAAFTRYFDDHPLDEFFELEADFVFGSMTPFRIVDLGYEVRPFADDDDRLYKQPGQTERKFEAIRRAKALA